MSAELEPAGEWEWEELAERLFPRLIEAGHRRFRLPITDLEDALQEVAARIVTSRPRARVPAAYFTTAFQRACLRIVFERTRRRGEDPDEDGVAGPPRTSYDPRPRLDAQCDVTWLLFALTPRCREFVRAWALEGRTLPETADATGTSKVTVWKRVNNCLGRLKRWVREDIRRMTTS